MGASGLNFSEATVRWPDSWGTRTDDAEQTFVDPTLRTSDAYAEVARGLSLTAGSPGLDSAVPLTYADGSYDGTNLTIRDGFSFSDGMDLTYFGVGGDYLQIGDNPRWFWTVLSLAQTETPSITFSMMV